MTVSEFIHNNADILMSPITESEFDGLTDGCVVFLLSAAAGKKPIAERVLRTAGYYMVVSSTKNAQNQMEEVLMVGLTNGGYAKIEFCNRQDIAQTGNKMMLTCIPLPQNDKRKNYHFM